MAWLRIDDGFAQHPKVVGLTPRDRWTWLELLCYCARYKTGGEVPAGVGEVVRGAQKSYLNKALELGLLDASGEDYHVHDWDDYNGRDPRILQAERQRRHRDTGVTDASQDRDTDRDENVTRAQARGRVPVPIPSSNPPNPPLEEEEEEHFDHNLFQQWLDYAQRQQGVSAPVAYARKNAATGVAPPVEAGTPKPNTICTDCGEKLGYGHLDDCPRVLRAAAQVGRDLIEAIEELP